MYKWGRGSTFIYLWDRFSGVPGRPWAGCRGLWGTGANPDLSELSIEQGTCADTQQIMTHLPASVQNAGTLREFDLLFSLEGRRQGHLLRKGDGIEQRAWKEGCRLRTGVVGREETDGPGTCKQELCTALCLRLSNFKSQPLIPSWPGVSQICF